MKISEIKVLKITKDAPSTILYETSYEQEEFQTTTLNRIKKNRDVKLIYAYSQKVGFTNKKKTGLLALFKRRNKPIPKNYLPFFEAV
ncbi:unnamed protein product [Acanthoscelides obtectus]|uniref:Uncharacterized protein n=1 Tax=Acanthoscelides obtectus TaxID=200917 RepID=A0A9P0MBC7_ACAOB|nr:unnamed protein product [Acanthoscelides obtectus]CAK1641256.1 hypothetical protein AOBTE_LOCUS12277 [Acanthoscelides obtectus]